MANYLDPYASELQGIQRQQELAKMLMQQGQQQPQEQMVSGRVAPINPLQAFLPALNTYQGMNLQKNAESETKKLADLVRGNRSEETTRFLNALKANPQEAMQIGAQSDQPFLQSAANAIFQNQFKEEEGKIIPEGGTMVNRKGEVIAQGNAKYRAPLHFDVGSHIEVRDPNDPTKIIARLPKGVSPNEAIRLNDEGIGAPRPTMPTNQGAPTSPIITPSTSVAPNAPPYAKDALSIPSKTIEQPKFDVPQPPAGLSPKQTREWFAEASKPLTGDPAKKVSGAIAYQQALDNYKNIISNFSTTDMANPQKRALLDEAYNTVTLTGKEAYNLGVLNGGDERILNGLQPNFNNPSSLFTSKNTAKTICCKCN